VAAVFATGVGDGAVAGDGVVVAVVAAVDAAGLDDALCAAADCFAVSLAAGLLSDRIHTIVATRTAIPTTPNNPTNIRARRDEGTGTASMGNGEDSKFRDAAADMDGVSDEADESNVTGVNEDAGMCGGTGDVFGTLSVSSANTAGSSGGGGSFGGSANAWKGTVRASSSSASMSARASSSMPFTAS
jgi:hypothetical protein